MLTFSREQCICALFMDPQISFFINFFIKNGSHSTIYTFKNYFATVISAISFQFQQNKSYPNRPYVCGMRDVYTQEDSQIFEEVWTSSFVKKNKNVGWREGKGIKGS